MKRLMMMLSCWLMAFAIAQAQNSSFVTVVVNVTDSAGNPLSGMNVQLEYTGFSGYYQFDSIQTDFFGVAMDTATINPAQFGLVYAQINGFDCQGNFLVDTLGLDTSTFQTITFNFEFCTPLPPPPPPASCNANFFVNGLTANLPTNFTNTSSSSGGSPSYHWSFGDGGTSTAANPQYIYAAAGTYQVCLTVSSGNCVDTFCAPITISNGGPFCSAQFTSLSLANNQVAFFPTSSVSTIPLYEWDFGDGDSAFIGTPIHTYAQPGWYQVCLSVIDTATNCTDFFCDSVFVQNQSTNCNASFSVNASPLGAFTFINNSTSGAGTYASLWDFGDGTTSTQNSPTHTYTFPGTYLVCVSISDTNGCSDQFCSWVTASGTGGTCSANFQSTALVGNEVAFAYTGFPTDTSQVIALSWDYGDGSPIDTTSFYNEHTYPAPGLYVACLTIVTDSGCAATFCDSVWVGNISPVCQADFFQLPFGNFTYGFGYSGTPVDTTQIAYYHWTFGDGNADSANLYPAHTYAAPGTYNVCLTIGTLNGCVSTFCDTVSVVGQGPCDANFFWVPDTLTGNLNEITFFNTSTASPSASYFWYFGDGGTSTQANPVHTYANSGLYDVCLFLTDTVGCMDSFCQTVFVFPNSNCNASFTFDTLGSSVQFTNTSNFGPGVSYVWDFGDGTTSTQTNPTHTYNGFGPYTVCLTGTDSTGCTDIACNTVLFLAPPNPCDASFIPLPLGNGMFTFLAINPTGTGSGVSYTWDFGDGSGPQNLGPAPIYVYGTPDTFEVCLIVTDSVQSCADTFCIWIDANYASPNCIADFTWSGTALGNTFQFTNLSSPAPGPDTHYFWDFGDGNTSTQSNPTHAYSTSGPWTVCMTVLDSLTGCFDQICYQVGSNNGLYNISGLALADSQAIFNGIVYLIEHDTTAGTLTAVDSTFLFGSFYTFSGVTAGTYLIKASLLPGSPLYANYLPTYLGDELFWFNATSVVVTNGNVQLPTINLTPGNNPGGPGFVGGLISQGANKKGDPMNNVSMLLLDEFDQPITHVATNWTGHYEFDSLAYGTYHLYVEMPGRYVDPFVFTLSPDNPMLTGIDFEITPTEVISTSINQVASIRNFRVYPNPATTSVTVEMQLPRSEDVAIRLMDLTGRTIRTTPLGTQTGAVQTELSVEGLSQGVYLLQVKMGGQAEIIRLMVD